MVSDIDSENCGRLRPGMRAASWIGAVALAVTALGAVGCKDLSFLLPSRYTISGHVKNADTGKGVAGVTVLLDKTKSRITDVKGDFAFPQVARGKHTLELQSKGPVLTFDFPGKRQGMAFTKTRLEISNVVKDLDVAFTAKAPSPPIRHNLLVRVLPDPKVKGMSPKDVQGVSVLVGGATFAATDSTGESVLTMIGGPSRVELRKAGYEFGLSSSEPPGLMEGAGSVLVPELHSDGNLTFTAKRTHGVVALPPPPPPARVPVPPPPPPPVRTTTTTPPPTNKPPVYTGAAPALEVQVRGRSMPKMPVGRDFTFPENDPTWGRWDRGDLTSFVAKPGSAAVKAKILWYYREPGASPEKWQQADVQQLDLAGSPVTQPYRNDDAAPGDYRVELWLGGQLVASRKFTMTASN
jgi:hypothetical protein